MKLRDVEFPGLGLCYLTQQNTDIEEAFDIGREIEVFGSVGELIWKAKALVHDRARRENMAARAMRAVRARHSWHARLRQLLEAL